MSDQYRRDYERGDERSRRPGDWRDERGGQYGRGENRHRDGDKYGSGGRGITGESGWDRGGLGRDERDSRDWQQRVDESQQGYRSRDPMFDRGWQREPDWRSERQHAWRSGREWQAGGGSPSRRDDDDRARWGASPNFAGRGPKGYKRSDDRIREEISDRLMDDHRVDASEIELQVTGGEVTLTGSVADRDQKWRAEDLVEGCPGVSGVTNNLRVSRPERDDGRQPGASQAGHTPQQAAPSAQSTFSRGQPAGQAGAGTQASGHSSAPASGGKPGGSTPTTSS